MRRPGALVAAAVNWTVVQHASGRDLDLVPAVLAAPEVSRLALLEVAFGNALLGWRVRRAQAPARIRRCPSRVR